MARLEHATPHGRVVVRGRPDLVQAALELALRDHERGGAGIERIEFAGHWAWFKRSTLYGRARWRWAVKHAFGARLPRVAEYDNLWWLSLRQFQAVQPLAAGTLSRAGIPLRQFLLTEDVPDAITLEVFLRDSARADRRSVLDEMASETARMHALGFVHHDLYPRNVLVRSGAHLRRLVFLDAWAGGPPPQLRGAAYDLACFFLRADTELAPDEVHEFLERYASERSSKGRPVGDVDRLLAGAKRQRRRLIRRLIAQPREQRGQLPANPEW